MYNTLLYISILLFVAGIFFIIGRIIGEHIMSKEYEEYTETLMLLLETANSQEGHKFLNKIENINDLNDNFYEGAFVMKLKLDNLVSELVKAFIVSNKPEFENNNQKYISYKKEKISEIMEKSDSLKESSFENINI